MKRVIAVATIGLAVALVHVVGAATNDVMVFYDLATMPPVLRGTTARMTPVITDGGSLFTGALLPGYTQQPHHHDNEQFTMDVEGEFGFALGDQQREMRPLVVGLVPSNVAHAMARTSNTSPTVLEYQPIARPDWAPPFPASPYKKDAPAPIPAGMAVFADLSRGSEGWQAHRAGVRSKGFAGQTIAVRMWDIAPGSSTDVVGDARVQRFVYVFDGRAAIESGDTKRDITKQMCVQIAASADHVTVRAAAGGALVGVFETVAR